MYMSIYRLKTVQKLPITLEEAWDYFSSPKNLKNITPEYMNFKIKNEEELGKMYPGQIIEYTVEPLLGIPLTWVTEITHVEELKYFVDEQRFGPYSLWHHKHFFEKTKGGVLMTDIVDYKLPMGFLGNIAHVIFVKKQLKGIFDYRFKTLIEKFGKFE
jgi:ligand-binding SRPBCC domain-containing protein